MTDTTPSPRAESDAERLARIDAKLAKERKLGGWLLSHNDGEFLRRLIAERDATIAMLSSEVQERTDNYDRAAIECDERDATIAAQAGEIERLNGMLGDVGRELDDQHEELARLRAPMRK